MDEQHLAVDGHLENEVWTPGEVDHYPRERLVQRNVCVAEAPDAGFVTQRFAECFAEDQADVFNGVMVINECVPGSDHVDVYPPMASNHIDHVRQESNRRLDARARAVAVEIHRGADAGLFRRPLECGGPVHTTSLSAARNAEFCPGVPMETRRQLCSLG